MAATSVMRRVISCSARRLTWRSRSARLSARAAIRFCEIRTKVERKIASTEATIARTTKDGSNLETRGNHPRLIAIQVPNTTRWIYTNRMLPVNRVTASAILSCRLRVTCSSWRCWSKARTFRSTTLAMDMSDTSRAVQHRQVFSPWTHGLGILATHHAGNLRDMAEVVRHPGGKQLSKGYRAELGMAAAPVQVVTGDSQRLQAAEAGRSCFDERVQQLAESLSSRRFELRETVEWSEL